MDLNFFIGFGFAALVWISVCILLSDEERIERFRKWFPFTKYPQRRRPKKFRK